jgi:hypothetical protein
MASKLVKSCLLIIALVATGLSALAQSTVPLGIHYQAVARNSAGNEISNTRISVRFSIIPGDPLATPIYQEVHQNIITSRFGVFSLVIGHGIPTGSFTSKSLSEIAWDQANHYLKVEVQFENDFMNMGTMQFLAVPYALYAQKSLEPGPTGPKGDKGEQGEPGDPASDNQNLSVVNVDGADYLAISGGNQVRISSIEKDGDPANEIQDLVYNSSTRELSLLKSTAPTINLTELKNDADADPTNEIQTVTYDPDNFQVKLSNGGGTATIGQIIAFRAGISSTVNLPDNTPVDIIFNLVSGVYYNNGGSYNNLTGGFTVPYTGIYAFCVSVNLPSNSSLNIRLAGTNYETLIGPTTSSGSYKGNLTMKLNKNDIVTVAIVQNNGFAIPSFSISGYFSGFRLY